MGRPKKYNSPRAYICIRKDQIKEFRELYPEESSDYGKVAKCIEEVKESRKK